MHETNLKINQLIEALGKLNVHDHPCIFYETREEMIVVVAAFVRDGFERGESCLMFIPDTSRCALLDELASAGIDTADALARRALFILDICGIFGKDVPFDAERIFAFFDRAIKDAKADGYTGLRLIGDMPWTMEDTAGTTHLIEYESKLNDFILSRDLPALCMYDRNLLPPEVLLEVLRTHPKVIAGQVISRNFSYLPPYEFFRPGRAEIEMNNLLRSLLSNEELISTLETKLALLDAVYENTPDIIYVKDLKGRFLMINPAGADFFGKPVKELLGRTAGELLSPEDAAPIIEADLKAMVSCQLITSELSLTTVGDTHTFLAVEGVYRNTKGDVIGIFGIARDITEQKRAEAEIADNQEELRFMASETSRIGEQERHKIASALHDQIGQILALAKVKLQTKTWDADVREEVNGVCELLDNAIRHTRSLTLELSSPILYELGLEAAVESLCEVFQQRYGIEISFTDDGATKPLSDDLRALLYQGLRELLVNIVKHARVSSASVAVEKDGACIRITVEDNGIGFESRKKNIRLDKNQGFGLFSLRERLKYMDGTFDVVSAPGHGTRVTMVAPLSQNE